ncbi:MAG: hypothetical protein ACFFD8_05335 [Candidatus Thorarchaeota archaeon]
MVLFGTTAELIFDINFILQIVLIVLLLIGYLQKRNWKYHGIIMGVGTLSMLVTVLLIMGPSLIANWPALVLFPTSPGSLVTISHVVFGSIALAIALFFTLRFLYFSLGKKPLRCGTRIQMRIQLTIWFLAFLFGLVFYIYYYVM